jgi:hypothetical protein
MVPLIEAHALTNTDRMGRVEVQALRDVELKIEAGDEPTRISYNRKCL